MSIAPASVKFSSSPFVAVSFSHVMVAFRPPTVDFKIEGVDADVVDAVLSFVAWNAVQLGSLLAFKGGISLCSNFASVLTASDAEQCSLEKPAVPGAGSTATHVNAVVVLVSAMAPEAAMALKASAQSSVRPMTALRPIILISLLG
jgi:hypothetical protein